jgi:hypothetical protein
MSSVGTVATRIALVAVVVVVVVVVSSSSWPFQARAEVVVVI